MIKTLIVTTLAVASVALGSAGAQAQDRSTGCRDAGGTWLPLGRVNAPAYCVDSPESRPLDTRSMEGRLAIRIDRARKYNGLTIDEASRARTELDGIRRSDDLMRRRTGRLSSRDQAILSARLTQLSRSIPDGRQ